MTDMPDMQAMDDEHKAWLIVVDEWRQLYPGVDLDSSTVTPMVRAIEAWGELLVALRVTQSDVQRDVARGEKLGAYLTAKANTPVALAMKAKARAAKTKSDPGTSSLGSLLP